MRIQLAQENVRLKRIQLQQLLQHQAATSIQCTIRQKKSKHLLYQKKMKKRIENRAALKIQKVLRGNTLRKKFQHEINQKDRMKNQAATYIQKMARSKSARTQYMLQQTERKEMYENILLQKFEKDILEKEER